MMRAYNLLVGIIVAVAVYMAVAVMRHYNNQNETDEIIKPVPQILLLPDAPEPLEFHPLDGPNIAEPKFEIKIENEEADEVLEVVATLADAQEYIKEYGEYHDDLFVYDIQTGEMVLNSNKND